MFAHLQNVILFPTRCYIVSGAATYIIDAAV